MQIEKQTDPETNAIRLVLSIVVICFMANILSDDPKLKVKVKKENGQDTLVQLPNIQKNYHD
jgi:hypothetical protein